jgi:glycosyltransferase involved in cell wall biosynthesis
VVADGATGWVTRTGDVASLADALDRVIRMPDAALAAMRAACLRRADDYSVAKMIARYTAFYEGLILFSPGSLSFADTLAP